MIKIENLWKKLGQQQVLKGLDLEIEKGETIVILGRSGVGKSVLLKHIMGFMQPDQGSITIEGQNYLQMNNVERRELQKKMGMLFQSAALFDSMNVAENTGFYLEYNPDISSKKMVSDEERIERVNNALHMVDLDGKQNIMPSNLSGGMRKRAALARLIVYRPEIILYDEPTTGLDPITATQINDLIVKTQKELHATSIVVTHDIRSAFEVGDRLALHHAGKIVYCDSKENFMNCDNEIVQTFLKNSFINKYEKFK